MAEPDTAMFFAHCGFMAMMLLPASSQSFSALDICCFNDRPHITNYTAQQCPSSHSSTLTFINILLVSLGARHFIHPPTPSTPKGLLLLLFKSLIFIVTKHALFWAQTLDDPDDWIHSVLSLATSPTPRSSVILMIAMFHHIVYRLQHQSDAAKKNPPKPLFFWFGFNFHTLCAMKVTFEKCLSWCLPWDARHLTKSTWMRAGVKHRGPDRGASGSMSHLTGQTRGLLSSAAGSRPVPPLSPHQWLCLAGR